ncbi:MAG: iron-sulfur cluster assembly scaffold protein [Planctomycetes bacterium]|nr:iron-sulfur cluster assembly scaffold protein [Planctomycetota bacterium]
MKSTTYSEKTLDHFRKPRNVGTLVGDDVAIGRVNNPVCGDLMEIYILVEDDRIKDIRFQTFGCGSAVATSSMITELVKGMTLDDAMKVSRGDVADALDGLPPIKMHCSNLAADALQDAIKNYREGVQLDPLDPGQVPERACGTIVQGPVEGAEDYIGKGYYGKAPEVSELEGKRVLVVDTGTESLEIAMDLTEVTGRVVFMTVSDQLPGKDTLRSRAKRSDVKLLYLSRLLEVSGEGEVEKVKVLDLDEDEEYELFVDSIILID